MYCSNCGTKLNEGSKFCNNCGAPQQPLKPTQQHNIPPPPPQQHNTPPPPPQQHNTPPPPPPQTKYQPQISEQVIGTVEGCATGFPVTIYSLLLTNRRIIAAKVGRFNSTFMAGGAAGGGIIGGIIGAGLDATVNKGRKKKTEEMTQMTPEMVLGQDKKNYQIEYASIQSVEMDAPGLLGVGNIKISTPVKEYKFQIQSNKEKFLPYISLFQQILPGLVILK